MLVVSTITERRGSLMAESSGPIMGVVGRWHSFLRGELPGGLASLLHDDVVFLSPIVYSPQVGKDLTMLYLSAAGPALAGAHAEANPGGHRPAAEAKGFHYVKEIVSGHHAMLEFETTIGGTYVNGVDIITGDDEGLITEFKVMIRPLKAVNAVHQQMAAMLESMRGSDS